MSGKVFYVRKCALNFSERWCALKMLSYKGYST